MRNVKLWTAKNYHPYQIVEEELLISILTFVNNVNGQIKDAMPHRKSTKALGV